MSKLIRKKKSWRMWKHFSELLLCSTAADVYQRLPPSAGSLSFLIQTLQHEQGQLSCANNKWVWSQILLVERVICYPIHVRCICGAIYCCSVRGEGCGRCVIISALIKEKWKVLVGEKNYFISKKNENCKKKINWKKMHYGIVFKYSLLWTKAAVHFYWLKVLCMNIGNLYMESTTF